MRLHAGLLASRYRTCQGFLGTQLRRCSSASQTRKEILIKSTYPSVTLPSKNLHDFILQDADLWSDLPAQICGLTGRVLTYRGVKQLSRQFGSGLLDMGLQVGDKIAIVLPNCPEFGPILLGSVGIGVTVVPISPMFTSDEMERLFKLAPPKLVVTVDVLVDKINTALLSIKDKPMIVSLSDNTNTVALPLERITSNDGKMFDKRPTFDLSSTIAILPFSSGTTGPPKGVMLTHQNLTSSMTIFNDESSGNTMPKHIPGEVQEARVSIIPVFHIFGLTVNIFHALFHGIKMVMIAKFEPKSFTSALEQHKPSGMNLVPPLISFIAQNPAITRDNHLSNATYIGSGGAPLSNHLIKMLKDKMAPREILIKEGYGMTECPLIARSPAIPKHGSIGKLVNNTEAKVINLETSETAGPGEEGELHVQGPHVMAGYYENEQATEDAFENGWFKTGDVVYYDSEGWFYIVDRIKDMIKVKGYQVSPSELEDVIRAAPGVLDVAVIGVEHEQYGEAPKAFIVKKCAELEAAAIDEYLEDKVASYKRLAGGIVFLTELPKSPTGKILRKELRLM